MAWNSSIWPWEKVEKVKEINVIQCMEDDKIVYCYDHNWAKLIGHNFLRDYELKESLPTWLFLLTYKKFQSCNFFSIRGNFAVIELTLIKSCKNWLSRWSVILLRQWRWIFHLILKYIKVYNLVESLLTGPWLEIPRVSVFFLSSFRRIILLSVRTTGFILQLSFNLKYLTKLYTFIFLFTYSRHQSWIVYYFQ